ncbi:MAG: phosphotransferase [Planctomycetota bacterium]
MPLLNNDSLKIRHSLFDAVSLAQTVAPLYSLKIDNACLLHRGFNDSYRISTPEANYLLRLYRCDWRNKEEILAEIHLLHYLKQQGLPVSESLMQQKGDFVFTIEAPEGTRYGALFTWAQGNIPLQLNPEQLQTLGTLLARIHLISDKFSLPLTRPIWNEQALIFRPFQILTQHFPQQQSSFDALSSKFFEKAKALEELPRPHPDYGLIHGDFLRVNFFENGSSQFTLFDFDFSGYAYRIFDLATFKWSLQATEKDPEGDFHIFLESYQNLITLSTPSLHCLGLFIAIRQLWVWSLNVEYGDDFRRLNDHQFRHYHQTLLELLENT